MSSEIGSGPAIPVIHKVTLPATRGISATDVMEHLAWLIVDLDLNRTDMFEIAVKDAQGNMYEKSGLSIGTCISIFAPNDKKTPDRDPLMVGEITNIEAVCEGTQIYTIYRGYDHSHRLQRVTKTRTYVQMRDSVIVQRIASEAKISPDTREIDPSQVTHAHISQIAQTDWDFIKERAREIGYETGVKNGKFHFRKVDMAIPKAATAEATKKQQELIMGKNLLSFHPKVSAANINPRVEVRVCPPTKARSCPA